MDATRAVNRSGPGTSPVSHCGKLTADQRVRVPEQVHIAHLAQQLGTPD